MCKNGNFNVIEAMNALKKDEVLSWVQEQLDQKTPPHDITEKLTSGLEKLGNRFTSGECFIPELIQGGEIFKTALDMTRPAIEASGIELKKHGTVLMGTVKGDLHDLGKNLVSLTLATRGLEVVDLGKNVHNERFVSEIKRLKPDVVGLSALLTTTMEAQREVIEEIKAANLRDTVKIIIGGAPVNQSWADEIGADAYAGDAIEAVAKVKALLQIL